MTAIAASRCEKWHLDNCQEVSKLGLGREEACGGTGTRRTSEARWHWALETWLVLVTLRLCPVPSHLLQADCPTCLAVRPLS